ncbi:MAG TPA: hypothetical protein DGG94_16790 [Micromonosporaceae bacterium]|nr:hypothetical protein [Micromonosporaceae bacterium]HCU51429.1 hypothetical protein [Micromonosporaceae bacterium]
MSLWTTRANESVSIGDLVALSVLAHSDAVGRIVAQADDGRIQCILVRGGTAKPGTFVNVEADQLLVKVYS